MLIVGELINASRQPVRQMIQNQDSAAVQDIARRQVENGACYIDVNAGVFVEKEAEYLKWLVQTVQSAVDVPCSIDSPNPAAIESALSVHKGKAMINSISLEKNRYQTLMTCLTGADVKVVALCMSDDGLPATLTDRISRAETLINGLVKSGIAMENIYVDALVQPISTTDQAGRKFLDAVEKIMQAHDGVHTICGLSNISYGLPLRRRLNETFLAMAVSKGLDAAILNPMEPGLMENLLMAEALAGRDAFCMNYIQAYRQERFGIQSRRQTEA